MARKQTLKSLLGGSDGRVQVDLALGTPALSPTVHRAGQYNVAVTPTPKTNSALQLAQALRVTPQILGQANNIAKGLGAEAALKVDNVEEAMLDDDAKGILGYNKAYQHGLVKRHFAMNEESIRERFKNVAGRTNLPTGNTDADRMASINEFVANLDKERDAFNQELQDMFGGDAHREEALQVLSATFVDELYDEAMGHYSDNLKQQAEMMQAADAQSIMFDPKKGHAEAMKYLSRVQGGMGVKFKQQAINMRNATISGITVAIQQDKLELAGRLIKEADAYVIPNAGKLFGSKEGIREMNTLKKNFDAAVEEKEVNFEDFEDASENSYDTTINAYLSSLSYDQQMEATKQFLVISGTPEEEANNIISTQFNEGMTAGDKFSALRGVVTNRRINPANDKEKTLMGMIQGDLLQTTEKDLFIKVPAGTITQEDADAYAVIAGDYIRRNPNQSISSVGFPKSVNGKVMDRSNPLVEAALLSAQEEGKWYTDVRSLFKSLNSKTFTSITSGELADVFEDDSITYAGQFRAKFMEAGSDLWIESGKNVEDFNALLEKKRKLIIEELQETKNKSDYNKKRYKNYVKSLVAKQTYVDKASKEAKGGIFSDGYPTLQPKAVDAAASTNPADWDTSDVFQSGVQERRELNQIKDVTDKKILMRGSLLTYGFPTLQSFDDSLMVAHNLSYADIPLGNEVLRSAQEASKAFVAQEQGVATPEQEQLINDWEGRGFMSSQELNNLISAQLDTYRINSF